MMIGKKYVLVSTNEESMSIDHETFDTLESAQEQMRKEWETQEPDIPVGDYIKDKTALVIYPYVYLWKIIEVEF